MKLEKYVEKINLHEKKELERIKLIAFFDYMTTKRNSFSFDEIIGKLEDVGYPVSNKTRAKRYIKESKFFKKSGQDYMLVPKIRNELQNEHGCLFENYDEISSSSEILDESLFCGKRGYLDKLVVQVNNCYINHCYDACAVLMRRIFEILLILTYKNHKIEIEIQDANNDYFMLEKIVANAISNKTLKLSRSRKDYDNIRELGNYSAHKIHYNARKQDIDNIVQNYRTCSEELFYKSGLTT